jgi:hypothetical protein
LLLLVKASTTAAAAAGATALALGHHLVLDGQPPAVVPPVVVPAVPPEDRLGRRRARPARHARGYRAGDLGRAPALLDPARPEPRPEVRPLVDDGAAGVRPEEPLDLLPQLPVHLRPQLPAVGQYEELQVEFSAKTK